MSLGKDVMAYLGVGLIGAAAGFYAADHLQEYVKHDDPKAVQPAPEPAPQPPSDQNKTPKPAPKPWNPLKPRQPSNPDACPDGNCPASPEKCPCTNCRCCSACCHKT